MYANALMKGKIRHQITAAVATLVAAQVWIEDAQEAIEEDVPRLTAEEYPVYVEAHDALVDMGYAVAAALRAVNGVENEFPNGEC